jgi:hypothetical protein
MASLDDIYDMLQKLDDSGIEYLLITVQKGKKNGKADVFFSLKNEIASPEFPARPVRPIRCTYSSMSVGKSKLTTNLFFVFRDYNSVAGCSGEFFFFH